MAGICSGLRPEPATASPVLMTKQPPVEDRYRKRPQGIAMNDARRERATTSGKKARQGRILLSTPAKRMIFFGAFAAAGLSCMLALIIAVATMAGR